MITYSRQDVNRTAPKKFDLSKGNQNVNEALIEDNVANNVVETTMQHLLTNHLKKSNYPKNIKKENYTENDDD